MGKFGIPDNIWDTFVDLYGDPGNLNPAEIPGKIAEATKRALGLGLGDGKPSGPEIPTATGREPTAMERIEALVLGGMDYDEALSAIMSASGVEEAKAGVGNLVQAWKEGGLDSALLWQPNMNVSEEEWLTLNDEERAFNLLMPRAEAIAPPEGEEEDDLTTALRELMGLDGVGGGVSDIGPNQMLIEREKMANALLIEKMQEEHMAKTGERSMVIDLMGDLLNREVSRHTMARDYVDRLLESAGMTVPKGMKYAPGSEPGGARDVVRKLAGITGEPAFPREIQTTPIPTHLLKPDVTPHDKAVSQSIAGAERASESVGLGFKEGAVIASKLLGFQGGFGGQMGSDSARELLGLPPIGSYGPSGPTDPYAAQDPNVMTGFDILDKDWLMDVIASQEQRDWAEVSGYMPSGAPTLEMQEMENNYKAAVGAASIYASGTVEAAQANAAAQEAAAALHAAATKYAADQGLKGDEVRAAADRYVADVQAKTAGERLAFDKARTQAQLAANPRTVFESLFLNRGMQPSAGVMGLQQQITPPGTFDVPELAGETTVPTQAAALGASPISPQEQAQSLLTMRGMGTMKRGGKVYEGPVVARVGERSKGSKSHETDEYALLAPGSVIAPRRKGEEPTMRNAVTALFKQATSSKPAKAQAGATVAQDPWPDYFKKAATGGLPTAQSGVVARRGGGAGQVGQAGRPGMQSATQMTTANWQRQAAESRARMAAAQEHGMARMAANPGLGRRPWAGGGSWSAETGWTPPGVVAPAGGVRGTAAAALGGGNGGGGGTTAPAPIPATAPTPTGQTVGDIPTDVLPPELLEAPAYGGEITGSLMRPLAVRGAFGQTAQQLSDRFNPLSTSIYDLAQLGPDELKAKQGVLSHLGMSPDTWFEASRRATLGAYGQPLGIPGGYARQTAGRLIR